MPEKRHSIAINIDEYVIRLVTRSNSLIPEAIYVFISINYTVEYWARFYQKDNRYVLIETEYTYVHLVKTGHATNRNTKFKNLLKEARVIELVEEDICLKNEILLQLI